MDYFQITDTFFVKNKNVDENVIDICRNNKLYVNGIHTDGDYLTALTLGTSPVKGIIRTHNNPYLSKENRLISSNNTIELQIPSEPLCLTYYYGSKDISLTISDNDDVTVHLNYRFNQNEFETFKNDNVIVEDTLEFIYLKKLEHNKVNCIEPVKYKDSGFQVNIPIVYDLFIYQKENIRWMLQREQEGQNVIKYHKDFILPFKKLNSDEHFYVDMRNKRFYEENEYKMCETKFTGGALLDEIGLGKTITMILGSLINPRKDEIFKKHDYTDFYVSHNQRYQCKSLLSSGKKKGLRCSVISNQIYCKRHIKNMKNLLTTRETNIKSLNINDFIIRYDKYKLLKSKATLLIVPSQVQCQWENEIKKRVYFKSYQEEKVNTLNVITIKNITDLSNVSYLKLLFADFVIITHSFLCNTNYLMSMRNALEHIYNKFKNVPHHCADKIRFQRAISLQKLLKHYSYNRTFLVDETLAALNPLLNVIHWHRIIVDEIHELSTSYLKSNHVNEMLKHFFSNYRWCVTGSPIISDQYRLYRISESYHVDRAILNIDYIIDFLKSPEFKRFTPSGNLNHFIMNELIRKNTNETTNHEKSIPQSTEETYVLDFSQTEKGLYDQFIERIRYRESFLQIMNHIYSRTMKYSEEPVRRDVEYLRELCSHPYLSNETKETIGNAKTLDDINKILVQVNENKIAELNDELLKEHTHFQNNEQQIRILKQNGYDEYDENINLLINQMHEIDDKIKRIKAQKMKAEKTLEYFNNVINKLVSIKNNVDSEECNICYSTFDEVELAITKCGHYFCYECIVDWLNDGHNKCPKCRQLIKNSEIHRVQLDDRNQPIIEENSIFTQLQNKHGTKLAHVIMFIKHNLKNQENRFIVFSQWTKLLKNFESIMKEENVNYVTCRGNIFSKQKALKKFKHDSEVSVITLSSEHAASGANLTEASIVIFLEPLLVSFNKKKCLELENQAIGRSVRLGQKLPVRIVRFIIKDSIEEEILKFYHTDNECVPEKINYI